MIKGARSSIRPSISASLHPWPCPCSSPRPSHCPCSGAHEFSSAHFRILSSAAPLPTRPFSHYSPALGRSPGLYALWELEAGSVLHKAAWAARGETAAQLCRLRGGQDDTWQGQVGSAAANQCEDNQTQLGQGRCTWAGLLCCELWEPPIPKGASFCARGH